MTINLHTGPSFDECGYIKGNFSCKNMAEAYDPHWSVSNPFELTFMTTRCEGEVSPSPSKFADWKFFCPKGKY